MTVTDKKNRFWIRLLCATVLCLLPALAFAYMDEGFIVPGQPHEENSQPTKSKTKTIKVNLWVGGFILHDTVEYRKNTKSSDTNRGLLFSGRKHTLEMDPGSGYWFFWIINSGGDERAFFTPTPDTKDIYIGRDHKGVTVLRPQDAIAMAKKFMHELARGGSTRYASWRGRDTHNWILYRDQVRDGEVKWDLQDAQYSVESGFYFPAGVPDVSINISISGVKKTTSEGTQYIKWNQVYVMEQGHWRAHFF